MANKLEIFKEWFLKGGGQFGQHVELQYDPQRKVHLRVAVDQELLSGSCIVSCPHALTLSQFNIREGRSATGDELPASATNEATSISSLSLLRFFLIEQYHLRTQSFWWPYINLLPDPFAEHPFDTPLYYDDDDLEWVRGTSLEHSRRKTEQLWKDEHAQGLQTLRQSNEDIYTWELYKWAATVISSRSFPASALESSHQLKEHPNIDTAPVLLPGLDLLNHSPTSKVTWQWTKEACCISNDTSLLGGAEIFNNYAPKSNEELILGYGFSLFRNPSDHCNVALGAMAVARIRDVSHQRKFGFPFNGEPRTRDAFSNPTTEIPFDNVSSDLGWVRLVPNGHDDSRLERGDFPVLFSEGFLRQTSIAFFNTRERQTGIPINDADVRSPTLTRNKLHTVCAITMMLQKQYLDIVATNVSLPVWPRNRRQFHAARYRRGQIHIVRSVSGLMIASLRRILGFQPSWPRDKRVVRLEHTLKAGPKEFLQDFRAAIHVGLGTRDAEKLRQRNLAESAFTLWLYGLWLWTLPTSRSGSEFCNQPRLPARTADWVGYVRTTYGDKSEIGRQWFSLPASKESSLLTESHHSIVKAAAVKNPQSIYNYTEATTDRLLWCLRVIREESFVCPDLEGEAEDEAADEIMLFFEDGISLFEAIQTGDRNN